MCDDVCIYIYMYIFVFKDTERDRYDYKFTVIANGKRNGKFQNATFPSTFKQPNSTIFFQDPAHPSAMVIQSITCSTMLQSQNYMTSRKETKLGVQVDLFVFLTQLPAFPEPHILSVCN